MVMSQVELRTVAGDHISLELPSANPTVADAITSLRMQHGYAPGVALMFAGRVLDNSRRINEFPDGNIIIAGHTTSPTKKAHPRTDSRRTQASGGQPQGRQQQHPQQHQEQHHQQQDQSHLQEPSPKRQGFTSPQPQERGSTIMNLSLHVPARNQTIPISVPDDTSVEQALFTASSFSPDLATAKLVFQGKVLSDQPKAQLMTFGVKDGCTLHVALASGGDASDPVAVKLYEIRQSYEDLKKPIDQAGGVTKLEDKERKMFYENSMKLLYRLDALEGLPQNLRQHRKDLVKSIQAMQDEAQAK